MSDGRDMPLGARIAVGRSLYPEIVAASDDIGRLVRDAAGALGLPAPPLAIMLDAELAPRALRIGFADGSRAVVAGDGVPAGAVLVRDSPLFVRAQFGDQGAREPDVRPWPDPERPGRTVSIIFDMAIEQVRTRFGDSALTAAGAAALGVARWFRSAAVDQVDEIMAAQLVAELPVHDAAALLRACPLDKLAALLRSLLREGVPIDALAAIAPLLADETRLGWAETGRVTAAYPGRLLIAAPRPANEDERRHVVARSVAVPRWLWQRAGEHPLQVWVLDEIGGWLPPEGAAPQDVDAFERQLAEQAAPAAAVEGAILLTSPQRRAAIAERLRPYHPDLPVVSLHELPRGIAIRRRGAVGAVPPAPPEPASRSQP